MTDPTDDGPRKEGPRPAGLAPSDPGRDRSRPDPPALVARGSEAIDSGRTIVVGLSPDEVLERFTARPECEPRWLAEETPAIFAYHRGRIFYEPRSDAIVLWRRPQPRWLRSRTEPIPYPDVLEVRVETIPRGARVTLQLRPHPLTQDSRRWRIEVVVLAMAVLLWLMVLGGAHWLLLPVVLVPAIVEATRTARVRRLGQELMTWAYAVLAPHELGRGGTDASAFRLPPGQGLRVDTASTSEPELAVRDDALPRSRQR